MSWRHGTLTGYERCNGGGRNACPECREARRLAAEQLRKRKAYGRTHGRDLLDATRALQALHFLTGAGHNTMAIARLSGLTNQQIGRLLNGRQHLITRDNHERVLAAWHYVLRHPTWTHEPLVDSAHSWQQLRSLSALGWSMSWLCHELGWARLTPPFRNPTMRASTAAKVQVLYDRLSGTRGPSARAAAHAARLGWYVPLAYDDEGRLIPEAIPNPLSDARERRERRQEREAEITRLTAAEVSAREIAELLGVTPRTVTRVRARRAS